MVHMVLVRNETHRRPMLFSEAYLRYLLCTVAMLRLRSLTFGRLLLVMIPRIRRNWEVKHEQGFMSIAESVFKVLGNGTLAGRTC